MRYWLKEAREGNGLTMKKAAYMLHISESYYCAIERGYRQRDMDMSLVQEISRLFKLPVKKIYQFEEELRRQNDDSPNAQ